MKGSNACLCGKTAFKWKWGGWVCRTCDEREKIQVAIMRDTDQKAELNEREKRFSRDVLPLSRSHSEEKFLDAYC